MVPTRSMVPTRPMVPTLFIVSGQLDKTAWRKTPVEALKSMVIDWQDIYSPGINAREYGAFPYSPAALRGKQ